MKHLAAFFALFWLPVLGVAGDYFPAQGQPIEDQFIVVLKDEQPSVAARKAKLSQLAATHQAGLQRAFERVLNGGVMKMNEARAKALANHPLVAWVEQDSVVWASQTQTPATWGIDRIDQDALPLSGSYTYNYDGTGVTAYIIDTGIRTTHNEFGGRASIGTDTVGDGRNGNDCNGHGTHVAGTVGGNTYGVAKNVQLVAVRVLNCSGSGTWAGVIAGIDWVRLHFNGPSVANMSLGGGASTSVDTALNNAVNAGVFFAVAAGNSNANACNYSPARADRAFTVASTTSSDARSSFSNYGGCVEIFAPGSSITSAWNTSNTATNTISGTSMATPHVAGAAALLLDEDPTLSPSEVAAELVSLATPSKVTSPGSGSPNLLLYALTDGSPPPPGTNPPTAAFRADCTDLACTFTDQSDDTDGTVVTWAWDFADGAASTDQSPSHTYKSGGTYNVTLTVIDDDGATDTDTQSVTVSAPLGDIVLKDPTFRSSGRRYKVDLRWTGATGSSVDIYRSSSRITTTANDGAYTDTLRNSGTYKYKVCQQGSTTTCSNEASVTFP